MKHPFILALRPPALFLLLAYSLQPTAYCLTPTVRINEVMASNGKTIADEDGDFEDWIELYNYGDEPVDLSGWGLSDSYNNPFKWTFPEGTGIAAGEYLLVWASGKDRVNSYQADWFEPYTGSAAGIWLFRDDVGDTISDSSAWGNTGQIQGSVGSAKRSHFGNALDFGRDGFIELGGAVTLDEDFTVAYWFFTRRTNHWRVMNSSLHANHSIGHWSSARIGFWNPVTTIELTSPFLTDAWEHFAVTRSGSEVRIFRNGEIVGLGDWEGILIIDRLGGDSGETEWLVPGSAGSTFFNGGLAEVILLPNALSDEGVSALYNAQLGDVHTNFAISASGEEIILTRPDGNQIDVLDPTAIPRDRSVGRVENGGDHWFFFDEPSPMGPNVGIPYTIIDVPVQFSHPGGFYSDGFWLVLSHPDPDVIIVYTLDGSEPDLSSLHGSTYQYKNSYPANPVNPFGNFLENSFASHIYEHPIWVEDRSNHPNKLAQISSTWDHNPSYMPRGPVRKGTVVRAMALKVGPVTAKSRVETNSYFVWHAGNPYSLPVISISTQEDRLFDYENGIYVAGVDFDRWRLNHPNSPVTGGFWPAANFYRRGASSEVESNLEIFDNDSLVLNQSSGIRVHGNWSRRFPIKNLRMYSRDESAYEGAFAANLFPDSSLYAAKNPDNPYFRRIRLRGQGAHGGSSFFDAVWNRLMQPVFAGVVRHRFAVSFINGEFWGIQSISDRIDPYHFGFHYNLNPDNIAIVSRIVIDQFAGADHQPFVVREELSAGLSTDMRDYLEMRDFIIYQDLSENENYDRVLEMLDLASFTDFKILLIYSANSHNEHGFWRARVPEDDGFGDGRWRVFVNDFDHMRGGESDRLSLWAKDGTLLASLFANDQYKGYFLNRYADLLNTALAGQPNIKNKIRVSVSH